MITSPADQRFFGDVTLEGDIPDGTILVRAKALGDTIIKSATAKIEDQTVQLAQIRESSVWQGELKRGALPDGVYLLSVSVEDINGHAADDCIYMVLGASSIDQREQPGARIRLHSEQHRRIANQKCRAP